DLADDGGVAEAIVHGVEEQRGGLVAVSATCENNAGAACIAERSTTTIAENGISLDRIADTRGPAHRHADDAIPGDDVALAWIAHANHVTCGTVRHVHAGTEIEGNVVLLNQVARGSSVVDSDAVAVEPDAIARDGVVAGAVGDFHALATILQVSS